MEININYPELLVNRENFGKIMQNYMFFS